VERWLGPDWQSWIVFIIGGLIFAVGMGYGLWKGNASDDEDEDSDD
jgi:hypothetical protein